MLFGDNTPKIVEFEVTGDASGDFLIFYQLPTGGHFFVVHIPNQGMARVYDDAMDNVISCSKGNSLSRVAKLDGLRTYTISARSASDSAPTPAHVHIRS